MYFQTMHLSWFFTSSTKEFPSFLTTQRVLPALLHGEAVNIDMSFMVYVAHQKGLLKNSEKDRIIQCMLGLELPVWHQDCSLALVQKSLRERLKHSAGSLRMPLPIGLGRAGKSFRCLPLSVSFPMLVTLLTKNTLFFPLKFHRNLPWHDRRGFHLPNISEVDWRTFYFWQ